LPQALIAKEVPAQIIYRTQVAASVARRLNAITRLKTERERIAI